MKFGIYILVTSLCFGLLFSSPASAQPEEINLNEVEKLIETYCSYLKSGNSAAIIDILGGPLLRKRGGPLKNDPGYGSAIAEQYREAQFRIEQIVALSNNQVIADLAIVLETGEIQLSRLLIQAHANQYKIVDEMNP